MSQGISNKKPGLDSEKLKCDVVLVLLGDIVAKKKKGFSLVIKNI